MAKMQVTQRWLADPALRSMSLCIETQDLPKTQDSPMNSEKEQSGTGTQCRNLAQIPMFSKSGQPSLMSRHEGYYIEDKTSSEEWPISKQIQQQQQQQQPSLRRTSSRRRQILVVHQIWTRLRINYINHWQKPRKHSGSLPDFSLRTQLT